MRSKNVRKGSISASECITRLQAAYGQKQTLVKLESAATVPRRIDAQLDASPYKSDKCDESQTAENIDLVFDKCAANQERN